MTETVAIHDLADPEYTDAQQAALAYGESLEIELDAAGIMAEAEATVGMNDWGAEDFLPRLSLLCEEWGGDTGLTGLGRLSLRNKLLQHATSRLLIQDQWRRHPEILDVPIESPVIVAGLPRSGTTHLLNLMAADSRLRALPLWESYEPVPRPGEESSPGDGADPRYRRCADAWSAMQSMTPHLALMHPMNPDHIHEELELMGPNFGSYNYEWLCFSPRWRDHYYAEDQRPHYEYMKNVLRLLSWQRGGTDRRQRWVLKCPQHLEQLRVLKAVFPDATVAITHRDPVKVIQSIVTMLAYGQRISRRSVMTSTLVDYWAERVEHLLRACIRDRDAWDDSSSIDLFFGALTADELGAVEKIYRLASLPFTDEARSELTAFNTAHADAHGRVSYDLEGQFGVSPGQLTERFGFYFDAFPDAAE